jgi:hypothetical protein
MMLKMIDFVAKFYSAMPTTGVALTGFHVKIFKRGRQNGRGE